MRVIWRVSKYGFRYPWLFGGAYAMNIVTSLAALTIPPLIGEGVDRALASGRQIEIVIVGLTILTAGVLRGLFAYVQVYLTYSMMGRVSRDFRVQLLDRLQQLSFSYHDRQRTGDLMSRATADVESIGQFMQSGLIQVTRTVIWFGVISAIMLATNWRLALIAMVFMPLATFVLGSLSIKGEKVYSRAQTETGRMTAVLQESISGIRLIKAFGASQQESAKFGAATASVARNSYRANILEISHSTLVNYMFVAAIGVLLWFGAREVVGGRLTEGELAMFLCTWPYCAIRSGLPAG